MASFACCDDLCLSLSIASTSVIKEHEREQFRSQSLASTKRQLAAIAEKKKNYVL